MAWKVRFYQIPRGDLPVDNFIKKQDKTTFSRCFHSIELLKNYGPFLKPPYAKKLQGNLYELRVRGKVTVRIFYTMFDGRYYLLHAFKKQTQKTPLKEIKTALDRINELR